MAKEERGSVIIEFSLIFPIIFITIVGLLMTTLHLYQTTRLQVTAQLVADECANYYSNPKLFSEKNDNDPYRYLFGFNANKKMFEKKVNELVNLSYDQNGTAVLSNIGEANINVNFNGFLFYKKVNVEIKQEVSFPINLSAIGIPNTYTINVTATALVNDPDEFIRNIDLVSRITNDCFDIEVSELGPKLNQFLEKLGVN